MGQTHVERGITTGRGGSSKEHKKRRTVKGKYRAEKRGRKENRELGAQGK